MCLVSDVSLVSDWGHRHGSDWYWSDWSDVGRSVSWSVSWRDSGWGVSLGCSFLTDDSVESVDVGSVLDDSSGAVSFDETVNSLDDVTVSGFLLSVVVTGLSVGDFVSELVLGWGVGVGGWVVVTGTDVGWVHILGSGGDSGYQSENSGDLRKKRSGRVKHETGARVLI